MGDVAAPGGARVSATEARRSRATWRGRDVAGLPLPVAAAALGIALVAGAVIFYMGRGSSFHEDEWSFMLDRNGHSPAVFLEPHNEHLSLLPIVLYKGLFELVGTGHYGTFRLVLIATNLVAAGLALLALRRFVAPVVALLLVTPLVLMGPAWSALYSPFQVTFASSMAFGLGALLMLDRGTRRGDAIASGLLVGSLACSGIGLPWLAFVAVELAVRDRRRLWVLIAPVVLYGIWYIAYGGGDHDTHPTQAMAFVLNAAAGAAGGYAGLDVTWGRTLVVALAGLALWRISVLGRLPARTAGAVAACVTFWGLTGLVRDPASFAESRYLLVGATWLVLAAAPLLPRREPTRGVLFAGVIAVLVVLAAGSSYFAAGRKILVDGNEPLYARLKALELARPAVKDGDFQPDSYRAALVGAARYFSALDRYGGSPALSMERLRASLGPTRREFDEAMVGAHGLALVPSTARAAGPAPTVEVGNARTAGSCLVSDGASLVATLPPGGALFDVPAEGTAAVKLRRLGDDVPEQPTLHAPEGARSELRIAADLLPDPWHVRVDGPAGTRVCGVGA